MINLHQHDLLRFSKNLWVQEKNIFAFVFRLVSRDLQDSIFRLFLEYFLVSQTFLYFSVSLFFKRFCVGFWAVFDCYRYCFDFAWVLVKRVQFTMAFPLILTFQSMFIQVVDLLILKFFDASTAKQVLISCCLRCLSCLNKTFCLTLQLLEHSNTQKQWFGCLLHCCGASRSPCQLSRTTTSKHHSHQVTHSVVSQVLDDRLSAEMQVLWHLDSINKRHQHWIMDLLSLLLCTLRVGFVSVSKHQVFFYFSTVDDSTGQTSYLGTRKQQCTFPFSAVQ